MGFHLRLLLCSKTNEPFKILSRELGPRSATGRWRNKMRVNCRDVRASLA